MTLKISQAFIFAAGRGERMKPVTDKIPKPLVKIKGKSIIDYTIEKLDQISSIKKIIINGYYLADQIEEHLKNLNNEKIIFSKETDKFETGGGLVFAKDEIDLKKPLLLINGDILWQETSVVSDIELLYKKWFEIRKKESCDILLGLKKKDDFLGYDGNGDFEILEGELYRFSEIEMNQVFVGIQIIDPKILERAPSKNFSMSHFYKEAIGERGLVHNIKGIELKGKYFHIGTVNAIKETEENL